MTCEICKGTERIQLLMSTVDCDCVAKPEAGTATIDPKSVSITIGGVKIDPKNAIDGSRFDSNYLGQSLPVEYDISPAWRPSFLAGHERPRLDWPDRYAADAAAFVALIKHGCNGLALVENFERGRVIRAMSSIGWKWSEVSRTFASPGYVLPRLVYMPLSPSQIHGIKVGALWHVGKVGREAMDLARLALRDEPGATYTSHGASIVEVKSDDVAMMTFKSGVTANMPTSMLPFRGSSEGRMWIDESGTRMESPPCATFSIGYQARVVPEHRISKHELYTLVREALDEDARTKGMVYEIDVDGAEVTVSLGHDCAFSVDSSTFHYPDSGSDAKEWAAALVDSLWSEWEGDREERQESAIAAVRLQEAEAALAEVCKIHGAALGVSAVDVAKERVAQAVETIKLLDAADRRNRDLLTAHAEARAREAEARAEAAAANFALAQRFRHSDSKAWHESREKLAAEHAIAIEAARQAGREEGDAAWRRRVESNAGDWEVLAESGTSAEQESVNRVAAAALRVLLGPAPAPKSPDLDEKRGLFSSAPEPTEAAPKGGTPEPEPGSEEDEIGILCDRLADAMDNAPGHDVVARWSMQQREAAAAWAASPSAPRPAFIG